jgi:DnaJ homolog subfamily C member 28
MGLFVERQLEEAARAGAFDHLPGAGEPIDLTENPYVPAEWRLAF